jgi:tripartite-type tricarboxylate transporter receptor subunit TctC
MFFRKKGNAMRHLNYALATLAMMACCGAPFAQGYPAKPIRMIVAYPPGASTDVLARLVSQQLGERLNTPLVVENRAGASGIVGTEVAARAPADGYTLLFAQQDTHTLLPILKRKLPYDVERDFVPLAKVGDVYLLIVANAKVPAGNVKELIALANAKPGGLRFASAGDGGINHLVMEMFGQRAGMALTHIPYKGGAPATLAVMAGEVELFGGSRTLLAKAIDAGQLRGVGMAQASRSSFLPNLPTMAEIGFPDFVVSAWFGVFAPAGLPEGIANRLAETLVSIGASDDYQKRLIASGGEGQPLGRDAFAKFLKAESGRWRVVIEKAGIKIED